MKSAAALPLACEGALAIADASQGKAEAQTLATSLSGRLISTLRSCRDQQQEIDGPPPNLITA